MNTILKYYIRAIFLIFPIVFIPAVTDNFGLGKNISLAVLAFVGLILWSIKLITDKEKVIKTNKIFWVFLLFVVWSGVTFFRLDSGSKMLSLMQPMGMGTLISFFILFFVWIQNNDKKEMEKQFGFLTISGLITAMVSLIVFLLPANSLPISIPKNNAWLSIDSSWSLSGSIWAEISLLLLLIVGWLNKFLKKIKERVDFKSYIVEAGIVVFLSLLFLLDIYKIIKTGWTFLDFNSAWVIAVETLKKYPIFGIGIGNFSEAFTRFRPVDFNLTKYWSNSFSSSSMGILQIWTELGAVGLLLSGYLMAMVLKLKKNFKFWQTALFLAISLFLPLNLISAFLLLWILSEGIVENKEGKAILSVGENNLNVMPYLVTVLVLAGVGFGGYWTTRIFLGDFYMKKSLMSAAKNDGTGTYELQIKAIGFNPYIANYRKLYSQVNLSLAQNVLNGDNVNDTDKEQASTLIQQSVREAKSAVTLSQKNPEYWYNLAGIYKSLVGLVDGTADWSYQAYQQAIVLDNVSPIYTLDMGGLLYTSGEYELAERAFEQTVTNKSDYANAWYNWAYAAKQQKKLSAAVTRLEQALTLVPSDSEGYSDAEKELATWKAELEKETEAATAAQKQAQTQQTEKENVDEETLIPTPTETSAIPTGIEMPTE